MTPRAERPRFPEGYGIATGPAGQLDWSWAEERLRDAGNYWISTTRPDGRPHAMPVWGAWVDDVVVFGSSRESAKARNLAANPAVVVHLESGDEVVILEGSAEPDPPRPLLEQYAAECKRKYGWANSDLTGPAYFSVRPTIAYAWLESEYPKTATRFRF